MTVSSVKNLNGETFSAVQDASLTDVVSSNSANWNEISAYQANSANYLQNTDLTIVDNKITEISGVPLSAGDELPSGVMNTSALEYNAVNEISGYNGSAIAQYGAEKQWLVHDDTLVHASNSAQYALGVNLSAVAQLLGVDETVLWSGTLASGSTASLSENITAFNKIAFVGYSHNGSNYVANGESNVNGTSIALVGLTYWPGEVDFVECRISNTTLTCDGTIVLSPTQGNKYNGYITKVIGIGRKS